jgi:hypothetical protein
VEASEGTGTPSLLLRHSTGNASAVVTPTIAAASLSTRSNGAAGEPHQHMQQQQAEPSLQLRAAASLALYSCLPLLSIAAGVPRASSGRSMYSSSNGGSGCSTMDELTCSCRTSIKHLHLLLTQQRVALEVVSTAPMQDRQQDSIAEELKQLARWNSYGYNSSRKKGSHARRQSAEAAAAAAAASSARPRFGWAMVVVKLLPRFLFDPRAPVSSASLVAAAAGAAAGQGQQQQQQDATSRLWSLLPSELLLPPESAGAAINWLLDALLNQQQLEQQTAQLHSKQQAAALQARSQRRRLAAAPASEADELDFVAAQQQQRGAGLLEAPPATPASDGGDGPAAAAAGPSAAAAGAPATAAAAVRTRYREQLELLCCRETAASAGSDVRQSVFEYVDSHPWQAEQSDPPGLTCQLFRWVTGFGAHQCSERVCWACMRGQEGEGVERWPASCRVKRTTGLHVVVAEPAA